MGAKLKEKLLALLCCGTCFLLASFKPTCPVIQKVTASQCKVCRLIEVFVKNEHFFRCAPPGKSVRAVKRLWNESQLFSLLNHLQLSAPIWALVPACFSAGGGNQQDTVTPAALLRGLLAFVLLPPRLIDDDPFTFSLACTCIYSASNVVSFPLWILLMHLQSIKCGGSERGTVEVWGAFLEQKRVSQPLLLKQQTLLSH